MRNIRWLTAGAFVLLALARPAWAQGTGRSAYDALDPMKLGEALRTMEMAELLEEFLRQRRAAGGETLADKNLLVEVRLTQAKAATDEPEKRRGLYNEAITVLREIIETLQARLEKMDRKVEGDFNTEWCETFLDLLNYRLKLAWVLGYERVSIQVEDMLMLLAAEEDRETVILQTADAARSLAGMDRQIDDVLSILISDFAAYGVYGPKLEELQKLQRYRNGMISLYRAMALREYVEAEAAERRQLAQQAVAFLVPFTEASAGYQRDPWAMLRVGQAYRVQESWDKADRRLVAILNDPDVPDAVKYFTLFERARLSIEQGNYTEADKRIAEFARSGAAMVSGSEAGQVQADWMEALLASHRFEWPGLLARRKALSFRAEARARQRRIDRLKERQQANPEMAERLGAQIDVLEKEIQRLEAEYAEELPEARQIVQANRQAVEKPLMDVVQKYAAQERWRSYFLWAIGRKYRDVEDLDTIGSLILLARATNKRAGGSEKDLTRAIELLDVALARDDENSQALRPLLLWEKAWALVATDQSLQAAESFRALAEQFPDHKLAYQAALTSVQLYKNGMQDIADRGEAIGQETRLAYVGALELLLERWVQKKDVAWRFFDLGEQYRLLSWPTAGQRTPEQIAYLKKSIEAFERTPEDFQHYMNARRLALENRLSLLRETEGAEKETAAEARDLVQRLNRYAEDARDRLGRQGADDLRAWGAEAAYQAALIFRDQLDDRDAALKRLRRMIDQPAWSDTEAVADARAAEIVILNESPDPQRQELAVKKVMEFQDIYSPKRAEGVLQKIVGNIRGQIEELRDEPGRSDELARKRRQYLSFAQTLHGLAEKEAAGAERMYGADQMLADALTEAGQYRRALALWEKCRAFEDQRLAARASEIQAEYDARIRQAKRASSVQALLDAAEAYFKQLEQYDVAPELWQVSRAVRATRAELAEVGEDPTLRRELSEKLTRRIEAAWEKLAQKRKEWLPRDRANVLGLARTHRGLKQYDQSLRYYQRAVDSAKGAFNQAEADRGSAPKAFQAAAEEYWPLELEFTRTMLEAFRGQPKQLKKLLLRVKVLENQWPDLGGLSRRFNAVKRAILEEVPEAGS